jgi:hypothetical protein
LGALDGFAHDLGRGKRNQIRRATARRAQREHRKKQKPYSTRENKFHESSSMPEKLAVASWSVGYSVRSNLFSIYRWAAEAAAKKSSAEHISEVKQALITG